MQQHERRTADNVEPLAAAARGQRASVTSFQTAPEHMGTLHTPSHSASLAAGPAPTRPGAGAALDTVNEMASPAEHLTDAHQDAEQFVLTSAPPAAPFAPNPAGIYNSSTPFKAASIPPVALPLSHSQSSAAARANHSASFSMSAVAPPNVLLPSLPGDGYMSGPYPTIRPFSAFEPLQASTAAVVLPTSASLGNLQTTAAAATAFPTTTTTATVQLRASRASLKSSAPSKRTPPVETALYSNAMMASPGSGAAQAQAGYFNLQPEASTSRLPFTDLSNVVPVRRPEPEICIECMMRDRDMVDVDVTTHGVWGRSSDVDFAEALAAEEEEDRLLAQADAGSTEGRAPRSSALHGSNSLLNVHHASPESEESGYAASASASSFDRIKGSRGQHTSQRKRIGRGQQLLAPSLKSWNSMTTPVSNFRWKNLQAYVAEQATLIDPAAVAAEYDRRQAARQSAALSQSSSHDRLHAASASSPRTRARSTVDDDRQPRRMSPRPRDSTFLPSPKQQQHRKSSPGLLDDANKMPFLSPAYASSNVSVATGMPPLQMPPRRFSSPIPHLPNVPPAMLPVPQQPDPQPTSPRSFDAGVSRSFYQRAESPSAYSERPRSIWSNFSRFRRGNGSTMSLALSGGSMLDMHLGLSVDRHAPHTPGARFEAHQQLVFAEQQHLQHAMDATGEGTTKRKKKGLKKFLSKIFDGPVSSHQSGGKPRSAGQAGGRTSTLDLSYLSGDSNEPLEPPVPSYLGASGRSKHERSASSSSQSSSFPHSPKDNFPSPAFRQSTNLYFEQPHSPAESHNVLAASQPHIVDPTFKGSLPISTMSADKVSPSNRLDQGLRREKSLPELPPEDSDSLEDLPLAVPRPKSQPADALLLSSPQPHIYSFDASRSMVGLDDPEDIGGGHKSKAAKPKLFSLPFRKSKAAPRDEDYVLQLPMSSSDSGSSSL